jgi:hypothetical protein
VQRASSFSRDQRGATAVEIAVLAPLLFGAVLSTFDIGLYFWRWNEAIQASRIGARIAIVSDPVASDLKTMTGLETSGVDPGEPAGPYERVCTGGATCSGGVYDAAAMNRIFFGVQGADCVPGSPRSERGMCDVLPMLQTANVTVTYRSSGVDTAGAAGALRPLVTVRITGANPRLVLFGRLFPATLPATETTMLAEDLRSTA